MLFFYKELILSPVYNNFKYVWLPCLGLFSSTTYMIKIFFLLFISMLVQIPAWMQTNPNIGIKDERHTVFAFTNAILHISSVKTITKGALVIKDEKIIDCGEKLGIPKEAKVIDCNGKHIYASFIETWNDYGLASEEKTKVQTNAAALYWNDAIKTNYFAYQYYSHREDAAEKWRRYGIGTMLTHRMDGIMRGSGTLVTLADIETGKNIIVDNAAIFCSIGRISFNNKYPTSLTGVIALIRQFLYDAQWYTAMKGKAEKNISIENYQQLKLIPIIFEVNNKSDIFRLEKIAKEFDLQFHYRGNGDEYERVESLKNISSTIIVPVKFPRPFILNDPYDADMVSLEDMYRWEIAPANLHILDSNLVKYLITTSGFDTPSDFFKDIKKVIQYGLKKEKVLYALTEGPAKLLKVDTRLGTLEKDKLANFIITEDELGGGGFSILENWVQGNQYVIERMADGIDNRGNYTIQSDYTFINGKIFTIKGKPNFPTGEFFISDTLKTPMDISFDKQLVTASFFIKDLKGFMRISVQVDKEKSWKGIVEDPNGGKYSFNAGYSSALKDEETKKEKSVVSYSNCRYPNKAYGWRINELKEGEGKSYLIKNVTVWTNEKEGILKDYDVITEKGKIKKIGQNLSCTNCNTIDGTGMHLTSGIIDEHSHIAMTRGVNEAGQSSSAEVRMSDVLNADDINIYRQLSGGVTTSQLLHGSANAIGGQSALIKLRWGKTEDELLFDNAPGFIKFALGENVKQSNWGDNNITRYPQTRMGVEQFYFEMFNRAKEYALKKKNSKDPVRKDLELETLCEILDGKRYITCHSYVQSEINMLMHVADSLGFKVNTFTHILEGYKVADKMKAHGANASTFADWWAYKFEVNDAIPYNSAILTKVGVNTCVNSDDAEMGRRLNHEAAKAVKYGGLSQEEAWKLCTLNPAKMLHIDDKVGSVKEGKDADLVLWSANPLSIYAKVKFTMIDGIIYYSEDRDIRLQAFNQSEKNRLLQKMMQAIKDGEEGVVPTRKQFFLYECETLNSQDFEMIQIGN